METRSAIQGILDEHIAAQNHAASNYFSAVKQLVAGRSKAADTQDRETWQEAIDSVYEMIRAEILSNKDLPVSKIRFGTSGWRGLLGKDLNIHTIACVTAAILTLYRDMDNESELREALGVDSFADMQERGCVVGFDNRFGGDILALSAVNVLAANNIRVFMQVRPQPALFPPRYWRIGLPSRST